MPGINFLCNLKGNVGPSREGYLASVKTFCEIEDYKNVITSDEQDCILGWSGYPDYPVESFENDRFRFFVEGMIYNIDTANLKNQLEHLADSLFETGQGHSGRLASWLLDADGDFVIFIIEKTTSRIAVFNDVFSRLPLYYCRQGDDVIISRNFGFASGLLKDRRFDRMAIAQMLLFNHSLGPRTLLENVHRVGPASLIRIDLACGPEGDGNVAISTVYEWNFENKEHSSKPLETNADRLAGLFADACRNRAATDGPNVLSLSGGLDSRLIAAALKHEGVNFDAISWLDSKKIAQLDVNTAREVAQTLGIGWQVYQFEPVSGEHMHRLLKAKCGQVYLVTGRSLKHYDNIKRLFGHNTRYFSGNCGDRITCDLRPQYRLKNIDDVVEYILREERRLSGRGDFPIETAAAVTGVTVQEIKDQLTQRINSYPEKDPAQKVVHYVIYEQSFKRYLEGDDRARAYFWNASPFWGVHFFRYIYNCPDDQKKDLKLYAAILNRLDERLCRVKRAINRQRQGVPIVSSSPAWWLYPAVKIGGAVWRGIKSPKSAARKLKEFFIPPPLPSPQAAVFSHPADLIRCMREQLDRCGPAGSPLRSEKISLLLDQAQQYNPESMGILFTVISAVEYLSCGRSTIEKYLLSNLDTYG